MNDLETVVATQEYIKLHHNDSDFGIETICNSVGYSRRQLDRLFHKFLQTTLYEYINAIILSKSAEKLINTDDNVLDVALDSHFASHEGYTRSFTKRFSITPDEYRKSPIAIPLYIGHPANHYHILKEGREMESTSICTVIPVSRPKRKLIYLPSKLATGYLSYCEEVGCDWEGLQNSIPEKLDTAAILELPDFLKEECYSDIASGVEVPLDYEKPLPDGYNQQNFPNAQCFISKVNHTTIRMISVHTSVRFTKHWKTIILNATVINLQKKLLPLLISEHKPMSVQELQCR